MCFCFCTWHFVTENLERHLGKTCKQCVDKRTNTFQYNAVWCNNTNKKPITADLPSVFLDNIKSLPFGYIYFSPIIYDYLKVLRKFRSRSQKDYMEENQEILQDQNQDDSGDEKHILQKENPLDRNNFNTLSVKVESRIVFSTIIYNLRSLLIFVRRIKLLVWIVWHF